MSNMRDIARIANVSLATVSRILRNDEGFKEDTIQRVLAVAQEVGYRLPTKIQPQIDHRKGSGTKIALVYTYPEIMDINRPYYQSIRHGIELESRACRAELIQIFSGEWVYDTFEPKDLAGIISFENAVRLGHGMHLDDSRRPGTLQLDIDENLPMVFIGASPDAQRYSSVFSDLKSATQHALSYLTKLGHKKIGYIGPDSELPSERLPTFRRIMHEQSLYCKEYEFITPNLLPAEGRAAVYRMMDCLQPPTAFFVGADPLALGALSAAHELGIKVPDDISVVSFGDADYAPYLAPPLTTIKAFPEQIGVMAVRLLVDQIEHQSVPVKVTFPVALVERESTRQRR